MCYNCKSFDFNPRSREGSDGGKHQCLTLTSRFQSTLPRRERLLCVLSCPVALIFQSTLPRRERRQPGYKPCLLPLFQSTLPRRERHVIDKDQPITENISIHAPAKGATNQSTSAFWLVSISIHAPAKGATIYPQTQWIYGAQFQSTLPRRERPG